MVDSDFDRPLGLDRTTLSARRALPYRTIAFAGLGLIGLGLFTFISLTGDPMGGEPYAIATIQAEKLPDRPADGQAAASAQTPPDVTGALSKRVTSAEELEQRSGVKVTRAGAAAPGALIIAVTPDLGIRLTPAPDPRLVEKTRFGLIPRIGSDGARPAEIYARPEGRLVGGLVGQGAILSLSAPVDARPRLLDWPALKAMLGAAGAGNPLSDILVRPEDVLADADGVTCRVESVLYEGERYALRLALPDGQTLRAYSRDAVRPGEPFPIAIRSAWRL